MKHYLVLCLCLLVSACGGGADGPPEAIDGGRIDQGADSETQDGSIDGGAIDAELPPDEGVDGGLSDADVDAVTDAVVPVDAADPVPVTNCQEACARFSSCGRTDIYADEAQCVAACTRSEATQSLENWFQCLSVESCNLLQLCRLPDPAPLTCEEACNQVDACGGIDGLACLTACDARNENNAFSQCAESLMDGACNLGVFTECLERDVYPECTERCTAAVGCNVIRADSCFVECIEQLNSDDPLRAYRGTQLNACIRLANDDCRLVDQCVNPSVNEVVPFDRDSFCREWDRCFADFVPCNEFADFGFFEEELENDQAARCIFDALNGNQCPFSPDELFEACLNGERPVERGPGCVELCTAQDLCGVLPEGQDQLGCNRACNDNLRLSEDSRQRQEALFPCGLAQSCDDLSACLERSAPIRACESLCERRAQCGVEDADCVAECDANFFGVRAEAERACVEQADACEDVLACRRPQELDCRRICTRTQACHGDVDTCVNLCDAALATDYFSAVETISCQVAAPVCVGGDLSWAQCARDNGAGRVCARSCLAQTQCALDQAEAMTECLFECGDGRIGEAAVALAATGRCLDSIEQLDGCPAMVACLDDVPEADCGSWCTELEDCELAPGGCGDVCERDFLAQIRTFEQLECLEGAAECNDRNLCVGQADEPRNVDLNAVCAAWNQCQYDLEFGPCEAILEGFPEERYECVLDQIAACPGDAFLALDICFGEIEVGEGRADLAADCRDHCFTLGQCGGLEDGQTIRTCTSACVDVFRGGEREAESRLTGLMSCRNALTCDAHADCIAVNSPETACQSYCEALDGCGAATPDCVESCDQNFYRNRHQNARACVQQANGDCAQISACRPAPSLPCEYTCSRLAACGSDDPDCVSDCDNRHADTPDVMAREFACLSSSARCRGASGTRLNQCQGDPSAGRECYEYCTAATGCNPASGELLGQCLIACGEGFTGAERLIFEESIQCFEREQPQACEARAACIPETTEARCEPWCTALATCELNDGCENTCDGDDLSGLRTVQQGACLDEAGEVCDDVNACLLTSLPEAPEPVAIDVLCRDYAACGLDEIFPCEFLADIGQQEGPGFLNCVAENLNPCPRDPFFAFEACLGGGAAPRPDFEPVCRQLCDTQAQCDELADGNARECTAQCLDAVEAGEDLGVQLLECRDALSCNALRECRQAVFGDACDAPCNQYLECGGQAFEDLAACREECNRQRLQPLAGANYTDRVQACLTALEDDAEQPELCAEQGESCFTPGFVVGVATCEELCPQLLECGGGIIVGDLEACIDGCRGADVEGPERNLELRACLTETLAAGICDEDVFFRCLEGPGPPPPLP